MGVKIQTREQVEAEVCSKLKKRKSMKKLAFNIFLFKDLLGAKGLLVDTIQTRLEQYKLDAARKLYVKPSQIKMRLSPDNYAYWRQEAEFYTNVAETEEQYERRIKKEIKERMKRIGAAKAEATRRKTAAEKKKREEAIKAIKYLGDDVYDVFKELNSIQNS